MNRRSLLRAMAVAGGVGLAGCGAGAGHDPETDHSPEGATSTNTRTPTPTATQSPTPTATPRSPPVLTASLIEQEVESTPGKPNVSLVNNRPTEDSPPIIRFTLTNQSDEPMTIEGGAETERFPVRPDITCLDDRSNEPCTDSIVVTLSRDTEKRGGCWGGVSTGLPMKRDWTLQPGESRSNELAVVNRISSGLDDPPDTCWPRGTFEFPESLVPFRITVNDDA